MFFIAAYDLAQRVVHDEIRLAAVRATGLLDSEAEESFDRLTRLAVRLVKAPAAFVSLVDDSRDFYKSACGLGEPFATTRQVEGPTFCHFAIGSAEPLVIPDTSADPVYRDIPTVGSLDVAAYVGIPIVIDGQAIGTFCAIDSAPHAWSDGEVTMLRELADLAVSEISLFAAGARPHAIPLSHVGKALDAFVRDRAAEKRIDFQCELFDAESPLHGPMYVIGDHERLLQILANLSTNAIEFTDEGGCVAVTAHRSGQWTEITVTDSGRGIARENLELIFEPFVQVGGSPAGHAGVGLGLATSRALARRMGGDISVQSELAAGATFTLRLRCANSPTPTPSALAERRAVTH
jgi:hypothetical protein